MAWLYVPDMEGWNLDLNESLMNTEPFVMLRGKPSQLATLSKRWKKGGWITRLSGLTCEPLTANRGVERWISSLEGSPANPTQVLENKWGKMMKETYGLILSESLAKCDLHSYSLKTSQVSLSGDLVKFSSTLPNWGIMLHGVLWEQMKQVRHIEEKGGSYLPLIPTPTSQANIQIKGQYSKKGGTTLAGYARMFPTPTVSHLRNHNEPIENYLKRVQQWKDGEIKGKPGISLGVHARMFPTPVKSDGMRANLTYGAGNLTLKGCVINGEEGLSHGGRLNPQWVAWLMGLPIGWINSDYWGME